MKLKDIVTKKLANRLRESAPMAVADELFVCGQSQREIEEIMRSDASGLVLNCPLLSGDEVELADTILRKLSATPDYFPSPLLLQAIRGINARVQMSLAHSRF